MAVLSAKSMNLARQLVEVLTGFTVGPLPFLILYLLSL